MQVYITFKNHELLRGVNWDVKRGERVGLVGAFPILWHIVSLAGSVMLIFFNRATDTMQLVCFYMYLVPCFNIR